MDSGRRADVAVGGLALLDLGLHLALAPHYGFHRDELYLLACGQRLDWGALDHGPLAPALSRLAPGSPAGQRVSDAVLGALLVWLTGLCARRLGGGLRAQALAAGSVAIAPIFIWAAGVHGTNALDQLGWTALGFVVVHALTARASSWHAAAFGLALGVAFLGKYTVLLWAAALALALLVERPALRPGWLLLASGLAVLVTLPNLAWQRAHGWPAVDFLRAHHQAISGRWSALTILARQPLLLGPLTLAVAGLGLVAGLRGQRPVDRVLARAFLLAAVAILAVPGKPYYLAPAYPVLLALGAVAAEGRVARAGKLVPIAWTIAGAVAFALTLPAGLRLLRAHPEAEQFPDWLALVAQLARAYHAAPSAAPRGLLTDSYGTAAAVERYGPAYGLPPPLSGANGYYLWSAGRPDPDELLVSGYGPEVLAGFCRSVEPAGRLSDPTGMDNRFDFPRPLFLCRRLRRPLREVWPALRRFD